MFLWISVLNYPCFYGYPYGYPCISIDIHALTCYGFSVQVFFIYSFVYFFMDPPPPHRGLTWFNKGFLPSLRNGPRGLCTVPSLLFTNQYTVAHQRHA